MSVAIEPRNQTILLCLLPFWSALTPPLGIVVLKGHLQRQGFQVRLADFNTDRELWNTLAQYVKILRRSIPALA